MSTKKGQKNQENQLFISYKAASEEKELIEKLKNSKVLFDSASQDAPGAHELIHDFREITEEQFDFWLSCLNRAAEEMGGEKDEFSRDDRQKTISYWYLLMFLLEAYAVVKNPFKIRAGDISYSDGILSMKKLSRDLRDRYKEETVRRYVSDLKRCGLVSHDGRGPEAMVRLSGAAVFALTQTINRWINAFRELDRRYQRLGA
jgi:hypothetical protein